MKLDVKVGDKVMITEYRAVREAEVVKIARVWITVKYLGKYSHESKFRLDIQTDGSNYGTPSRFYTMDQWEEKQRRDEASIFLSEQGISLEYRSPWRGREIELANVIRAVAS